MTIQSHTLLHEWFLELQTIDRELEGAANNILENCDKLVSLSDSSGQVQETVTSIMENCTFHDLNSQRLRKIITGVSQLTQYLESKGVEIPASLINLEKLASGPQREGIALTQADVESVLKN